MIQNISVPDIGDFDSVEVIEVLVKVGDQVLKGELIAEADGNISAAIHAPTSGKVNSIEKLLIPHPSGLPDFCVTLIPDNNDKWIKKFLN